MNVRVVPLDELIRAVNVSRIDPVDLTIDRFQLNSCSARPGDLQVDRSFIP